MNRLDMYWLVYKSDQSIVRHENGDMVVAFKPHEARDWPENLESLGQWRRYWEEQTRRGILIVRVGGELVSA